MTKEFVKYEQALALKELGFNESCFVSVDSEGKNMRFHDDHTLGKNSEIIYGIYLPLYQQTFRWFREKYDLRIWIESNYGVAKFEYVIATTNPNFIDKQFNDLSAYKTYEKAESACLDKLIEIVKNK